MSITLDGTNGVTASSPATIKASAYLDAAGGNTATINGVLVALASQAQAQAGTDNATLMTPLRVAQEIAALTGINMQTFTFTATYTPTAGYSKAIAILTNGSGRAQNGLNARGGEAGGTFISAHDISDGAARTVTVGAASSTTTQSQTSLSGTQIASFYASGGSGKAGTSTALGYGGAGFWGNNGAYGSGADGVYSGSGTTLGSTGSGGVAIILEFK